MKNISFGEFVKMLNPSYKIPEYMKSFIKDIEKGKKYCVCLHKNYGKRTIIEFYNKYLEGDGNET